MAGDPDKRRAWLDANRERVGESHRQWLARQSPEYHEARRQKKKAASVARRVEINARRREWRKANPDKKAQYEKTWNDRNPERAREIKRRNLLKQFGLTLEQWDSLLASQGGCCAVCRVDHPGNKGWQTDHCHKTGIVRGILCGVCNRTIGLLGDDLSSVSGWSANAVRYLSPPAWIAGVGEGLL